MNIVSKVIQLSVFSLLTSCATYSDWKPTVDSYNDLHAGRISQDMAECKQLSAQASGDGAEETAKGAALGATLGGFGGGDNQGFFSA